MKRRLIAFLLLVVMLFGVFEGIGVNTKNIKAAGNTLILHYNREDNNYDGWNAWVWPDGKEGTEVKFSAEDDFGKVAVFNTSTAVEKIGFIIRLNEWEKKDIEEDRYVTLDNGIAEVWIYSGDKEIHTTPPTGATPYTLNQVEETKDIDIREGIEVNLHYHRYDNAYEGWNVWAWPKEKDGMAYQFTKEDDFGKIASFHIQDAFEAGIIVRLNEWERKDYDQDRFIDLSKAKDGVLDVYVVQSDPNIYYDKSSIDLSPKFLDARFYNNKEITFTVTVPIDTSSTVEVDNYTVLDEEGNEYKIMKVWSKELGMVNEASLIMEEKLDLDKSYTVTRKDYGNKTVSMGEVFNTLEFNEAFYYEGNDLGYTYSAKATSFRLWAPTASKVTLNLYKEGMGDNLTQSISMTKDVKGTWVASVESDLKGVYYTYSVTVNGIKNEAVDPYARTTGANGLRAMVLDLSSTNPEGFLETKKPEFLNATDAIIYELHVRDLSADSSSGIKNVGKFLGLTEKGTKNKDGLATGLDHLIDIGITHLHLLPAFDYATIDETKLEEGNFNWGYDPENYNVPEGSYSTNPYLGDVRVREFKQMVKALHENGIRVVMDVVYNHTSKTADSNFNKIVPDYYYRKDGDTFSNGSGCGNEIASERAMVRKYIVDSVVYWATEYKIDGFRFDLMGLHDIDTMNEIREALNKIDPSIIIYGEGWTGGSTPLPEYQRALKANASKLNGIAVFSDDIRDGIKGSVFNELEKGYVSGREGMEESIKFGIVASTNHPQIDFNKVNYSTSPWASEPSQTINYASAHDNLSLWDKLTISNQEESIEDRVRMNRLSAAIVLTSQGIPFFQAGEEILRSKVKEDGSFDHNSYKSSDFVNSIKWNSKTDNMETYEYYKGLIEFRKAYSQLRMTSTKEISSRLKFVDGLSDGVIAYQIEKGLDDSNEEIYVIFNANKEAITHTIPEGTWKVYVDDNKAGTEVLATITNGSVMVEPISAMVLVNERTIDTSKAASSDNVINSEEVKVEQGNKTLIYVALSALFLVVSVVTLFFVFKRKKSRKNK